MATKALSFTHNHFTSAKPLHHTNKDAMHAAPDYVTQQGNRRQFKYRHQ